MGTMAEPLPDIPQPRNARVRGLRDGTLNVELED